MATGTVKTVFPVRSSRHDRCSVCGNRVGAPEIENTDGWRWFNDGRGGLLPLCSTCVVPDALIEIIPPGTSGPTRPDRPGRARIRHVREAENG
jgi:hypothetical protein